jgi:hypothetical protein
MLRDQALQPHPARRGFLSKQIANAAGERVSSPSSRVTPELAMAERFALILEFRQAAAGGQTELSEWVWQAGASRV